MSGLGAQYPHTPLPFVRGSFCFDSWLLLETANAKNTDGTESTGEETLCLVAKSSNGPCTQRSERILGAHTAYSAALRARLFSIQSQG